MADCYFLTLSIKSFWHCNGLSAIISPSCPNAESNVLSSARYGGLRYIICETRETSNNVSDDQILETKVNQLFSQFHHNS